MEIDKEKFVQRVNVMLYDTCGCNKEESIEVLEECLKQVKGCRTFPKGLIKKPDIEAVKKWANYVKTHPDRVWSKQQNILINSLIKNARHSKLTPKQYLKLKGELR